MIERTALEIVERLRGQVPLSPAFASLRDDLSQIGAAESRRLMQALAAVYLKPADNDQFGQILRQVERWSMQLQGNAEVPPAKGWFWRRKTPDSAPRAPDQAEISATLSQLHRLQDAATFQLITAERMASSLEQVESDAAACARRVKTLRSAVEKAWPEGANDPLGRAVTTEIVPALLQREATILTELALSRQARLALAAIHHGNKEMVGAIVQTAQVVRALGIALQASTRTDRDIDAANRELRPWLDALAAIGDPAQASPNQIDPDTPGGQAAPRLKTIRGALGSVENAFARLDDAHARLGQISASGRQTDAG